MGLTVSADGISSFKPVAQLPLPRFVVINIHMVRSSRLSNIHFNCDLSNTILVADSHNTLVGLKLIMRLDICDFISPLHRVNAFLEEKVMHRVHIFCIVIVMMILMTNSSSNALAYWPIVFQVAKDGADFQFSRGPVRVVDNSIKIDSKARPNESVVSYKLVLKEYVSFQEDIFKAMEAFVQIYPSNVRANETGKTGELLFNGAIIKRYNMVLRYPGENFSFDESNYRFGRYTLDFPIPLYGYLSNESAFIRFPVSLLAADNNLTFRMDPNVLWEVSIVSVIVHIIPEKISPWWMQNLPTLYALVLLELTSLAFILTLWLGKFRFFKRWMKGNWL